MARTGDEEDVVPDWLDRVAVLIERALEGPPSLLISCLDRLCDTLGDVESRAAETLRVVDDLTERQAMRQRLEAAGKNS